eukprot:TRINITY_DN3206_c0_g1_i1.p1 TRINITY_DN3206_c0_g1~~TRINITY_DN3206_c0_g1_i1.p1  ORF type:complete len:187 (+),score=38.72 TRINITY_DN3206_c0_g1_i1:113-673(+)
MLSREYDKFQGSDENFRREGRKHELRRSNSYSRNHSTENKGRMTKNSNLSCESRENPNHEWSQLMNQLYEKASNILKSQKKTINNFFDNEDEQVTSKFEVESEAIKSELGELKNMLKNIKGIRSSHRRRGSSIHESSSATNINHKLSNEKNSSYFLNISGSEQPPRESRPSKKGRNLFKKPAKSKK